ncbi:Bax protein [Mariprofundus ferrinatatus]|uniref:Bax protein n=1 Tax=Mariprofundus ferrinatatus TaxID=1921087 RepID=A0A2K8L6W3_9PROT|nr:glucosaminidase domain-containing protein [Mariprofundus ferrinatatus]ATX82852.1 Bax protein [Mariprofundus ferrinatatus]
MKNDIFHSITTGRIRLFSALLMVAVMALAACSLKVGGVLMVEKEKNSSELNGSVEQKKQAFFARMKPLVEAENERILEQREDLLAMRSSRNLGWFERRTLQTLAEEYEVEIGDEPGQKEVQALLMRVDAVPVEMALVQAANESSWGESRFAVEGNNYFGQWCYSKGCGIVPEQRSAGATHEVRRFDNARDSVRAYMNNINTTRAYVPFRKLREEQRKRKQELDAVHLALGLKSYSERGMAYVKTIQAMIRSNRKLIASS